MSGVSLSVTSTDLDGVLNRVKKYKATITGELTRTLNEATAQGKRTIQAGTPVRTGRARAGVKSRQTGPLSREIYDDVPYFIFLVLGTRYMFPIKTLVDAIATAQADASKTMEALGSRLESVLEKDY